MSRTDKTRPYWVKAKDFPVLYPRATEGRFWTEKWWVGELKCGCPVCSDKWDRKTKNRRKRYAAKAEIREQMED